MELFNLKYYLVFSAILHIVVLAALVVLLLDRKVTLQYFEKGKMNVQVADSGKIIREIRNKRLTLRQDSRYEIHNLHLSKEEMNNQIESFNIDRKIKQIVNKKYFEVSRGKFKYEQFDMNPDLLSVNEQIELDEEMAENAREELVVYQNGTERKLILDQYEKIRQINIDFNTRARIRILIDSSGRVILTELVESTGDPVKDRQLQEIVGEWVFEESSLERQSALINLRYLLK